MTESKLMIEVMGIFLGFCLMCIPVGIAIIKSGNKWNKRKYVLSALACAIPFLIVFLFCYFMDASAVPNCQKYEVIVSEDKFAYIDDSGTLSPINSELKEAELTTESEPYYEVIETEYFGGMFKTREEQLYIPIK